MNKETRLVDNFRQKYFNIYINTSHESIQSFFQEVHINLEKDLEYDAACELFSAILTCFTSFSEYSLPFLNEFLDKFKSNQNYILITSSILLELTHDKRQLNIPYYQNLIDDCLNEVFPQISNENDEIVIFGHKIQQNFLNTLFLNLFSLSNLTPKLFQTIFPYILADNIYANNQKFDLVLQNLSKSDYIQLNPLTDASNKDLLEILTHDLKIPHKIDENTLLFFTISVIFTKSGGEMEINGLSVENILPFTALTILYHSKLQPIKKMTFSKINGLLINSITSLNCNSPVFNASINIILNNLENLFNHDLLPVDSIIQIVIVLLKKLIDKEFYADKLLLLSIFFNYSNYELCEPLKKFVDSNQADLFDLIFGHLTEIDNRIHYSLNFKIFESNLLYKHIQKLTKKEEIIQVLFFIDNYCTNLPNFSESFEKLLNEKISGEKLNDVSFLNHFMKKNDIQNNVQGRSIPKDFLFENDEIITYLLIDCHPEKDKQYDEKMKNLLTKMLNDKEIFHNYIFCSTYFLTTKNLTIPSYLTLFVNEYELNPNDFMNIVNQFYAFNSKNNILEFNTHFSSTSLPNSEFGYSIISKLLDIANENPGNYRVFLCLKNIAQLFPFLFNKDYQKVFDIVLKQLDSFYLLFENDLNEESLNLVKTGFLALFFLLSTLQLPCILDKFIYWLFTNIQSFSASQIFGFFSILLNIKYQKLLLLIYSKMIKFDFITICKKLLEKEIGNETFRSFYMKQISEFVSRVYTNLIKYIFSDENKTKYLQIIEYSKLEQVINYLCNTIYCQYFKFPYFDFIFESELFSKQFATFLYKVNLTTNINTNKKPTELQINAFKSKIKIGLKKSIKKSKNIRDKRIKNLKENDKNIDHLLIPIFKSYLSFMSCSLVNYRLDLNLSEVLNQFNDDDDYITLILNSFIEYLEEFSSNEIGLRNIKSIHQLITIFEMITEARIDRKDIFYPYIDKLINIILLPKWRIDSFLISKVIFLLARLHILPSYTTKIILGKSNTQQFNRSKYYSYYLYNKVIEKNKNNLTDNEKIDNFRFQGNVGITNINTLYSYILIDNNCYEQEINKNIEEEVEFEKAEIFYQYSYLIERLYKIFNEIDHDELYSTHRYMFIGENLFNEVLIHFNYPPFNYIFSYDIVQAWLFYLLFKKASDLDYSYMNLVVFYFIIENKLFINKDKKFKYLEKAAESGVYSALKYIADLILDKNEKYKPKDIPKWIEKTIKVSNEIMFEYGESLIKNGNNKEGLMYIKEAADDGNLQAVSFLHYEYKKEKGYLENSAEFFINEAKKYKQILMDYKQDNNKVFVDENFPAFKYWKRIDEIYKAPLFQKDLIDPSFVNQGKLGDCYLISAFSRIAKQHYLVPLLFEKKLPNSILGHVSNSINIKCGAVVVYFQAFGQKLPVLVDTLIPVDKDGKPIASRPSDLDKSPWFIIVEKAFAKLNGSYDTIHGGIFSRSIYSLFFCCPIKEIGIPSFDFLMEKQKEGCIMSASSKEGNKDASLPAHHSFLILKVRSYNGVNLIFCRNPWGTREFSGKYSRYSDEWTPELKKAFNYDYYPRGTFWISYDELQKYFDKLDTIQPINPEWYIKMAQFKLIPSPEDKLINYSSKTHKNRKIYIVQIKDNIPFGEEIPFYFIVERRNSTFTSSKVDKFSNYELIIISKSRTHYRRVSIVEAFKKTFKNIRSFKFLINRNEQSDLTENFYVNIVCKYKFDVFDDKDSKVFAQTIINPGIVFENYTLSNPEISKKLKLKLFNKKFILSLDEEKSNLNDERDEQIKNLFSYINMDFSSSFINLNELYTFTKTLIGNGTYSNVYIVNDKETNKQYAAKILKYSIEEIPIQFLNELNVLRSLRYPSIIKFIGFSDKNFKDENYPTIIVEYLKNGSLLDLINEVHKGNKELTNTKKMMILLGVALGIDYLHKHGIIHCDLKLENILLDDDLNPKICDFGDSKHLDTNNAHNIGTPLYMAPEVINGQPHSFLSDVYSFGVILYYLYTDQIPNVNEPINKSIIKSEFVMQLLDENPENRPTFRQIVSSFLTKKEKTWLDNVNEDEIEKFLHTFGLTIKPFNPDIDLNFIRSIDIDKYPENAQQPKMTIEEIMINETISSKIKNDIQLAEKYLNLLLDKPKDIDVKEIRKHLFNIGYQFCMGDKEASKNIQEDYFYAIKYLKEAALLGDKTSLYLLASLLSNNQNTLDVAFKLAEISADLGCSEAFHLIAVFYKNGIAVQSNVIMAAIYFKIAADKGEVSSMFQFANIMLQIGQKEIDSSEFNKQLEIAHDIIRSIDGKCNRVYKEIRYTLEAIENVDVALFVSGKYFEMAALNGNDEAKKVMRNIDVNSCYNHNHPDFYDDLYQTLSLDNI